VKALSFYHTGIKDMPENMRPREKLMLKGEKNLEDAELLAIILGQGTRELSALELARLLMIKYKSLRKLKDASLEELQEEKGIGPAKAVSVKAAIEMGRRMAQDSESKTPIKSPEDVKNMVMEEMRYFDREHFRVLYLDRIVYQLLIQMPFYGLQMVSSRKTVGFTFFSHDVTNIN
jgi:DNA repair protein RadC